LREPTAAKLYKEYWRLQGLDKLNTIYQETNGKTWRLWNLYKQLIKEKGMGSEKVANAVDIASNKLPHMDILYRQVKEEVENLQRIRQGLINDIEALKYKISLLDKIAFSCEQESRRTEQQIQELTVQKDRLEKWIANVSNNHKLKQLVKENVKAALSENKQVISVAFTALLQTLKSDPQIINIIYKIMTANDGEQQKDNNNDNAIK
jgi:coenzyme F420-reducing hydrogenase delta subunit